MKIATPREKITRRGCEVGIYNAGSFLRTRKAIVVLACGHYCLTRNLNAATCPRCCEMLRRSIETGKEDYETFRHGNGRDHMDWPADPCVTLNQSARTARSEE